MVDGLKQKAQESFLNILKIVQMKEKSSIFIYQNERTLLNDTKENK